MHLAGVDLLYWAAGFLGHLILCGVLWLRHRAREFPIFASWVASNLARTIVLFLISRHGGRAAYYYTYWTLAVFDTALQFAVVYEMYSKIFRPLGVWAPDVQKAFIWLLSSSLGLSGVLTVLAKPHTRLWIQSVVIKGNLFTSVCMSELFVGMVALSVKVGLPWKAHVGKISQGLGAYSLFGVVLEGWNSYFGLDRDAHTYTVLSRLRMSVYLCCLAYWIVTLWRNAPDSRQMTVELREQLAKLQARLEFDLQRLRDRS
jgi:hypothetical protein